MSNINFCLHFNKLDILVTAGYSYGKSLLKNKKFRELQIKSDEHTVKHSEFYAEAYIRLIIIYTQYQKDIEKAKKHYEKLLFIYPFFSNNKEIILFEKYINPYKK